MILLIGLMSACSPTSAPDKTSTGTGVGVRTEIKWEELMSADDQQTRNGAMAYSLSRIDHNSTQRAPQFGSFNTVAALE